jgi:hypothetical protein
VAIQGFVACWVHISTWKLFSRWGGTGQGHYEYYEEMADALQNLKPKASWGGLETKAWRLLATETHFPDIQDVMAAHKKLHHHPNGGFEKKRNSVTYVGDTP